MHASRDTCSVCRHAYTREGWREQLKVKESMMRREGRVRES